jgi:hypothetical protein
MPLRTKLYHNHSIFKEESHHIDVIIVGKKDISLVRVPSLRLISLAILVTVIRVTIFRVTLKTNGVAIFLTILATKIVVISGISAISKIGAMAILVVTLGVIFNLVAISLISIEVPRLSIEVL